MRDSGRCRNAAIVAAVLSVLCLDLSGAVGFVSELRRMGYSLIPTPQKVELDGSECVVDSSWGLDVGENATEISVRRLREGVAEFYGLEFRGSGRAKIRLRLSPGCVQETEDQKLNEQGYRLEISPAEILVEGSGEAGLFYGVQSLLQLLRRNSNGQIVVPAGKIIDWPDFQLRFIHWDTKHHQKRYQTLFRMLDWAAFFKVNAIGFEMEDKYEYPSNPIIGAPGAYTKEQMQKLTAYALERHIQLVPVIQSPAHMAYVLKHEEFKHLRADPASNYQACLCDEEAIELILELYQDMIDATPGVKYFHVSTDEVYFAGICDKCGKPFNDENRSQAWVDFVNRVHPWLSERGRTMLAWVEWPLMAEHISQLPPTLIDGVMGGDPEFLRMERAVGIRQLAYSSIQGMEDLFPNYFPTVYRGRPTEGRLKGISQTIRRGLANGADPIGSFAAAASEPIPDLIPS
ncbi:MAG: beta-N-acetylhexosaminidase, partial [bacterium]